MALARECKGSVSAGTLQGKELCEQVVSDLAECEQMLDEGKGREGKGVPGGERG